MKVNKVNRQYTQVHLTPNLEGEDRRVIKSMQSIKVSTRFNLLYTVYKKGYTYYTHTQYAIKRRL
jgi:hypothetical protein